MLRCEEDVLAPVNNSLPRILGAICDALSAILLNAGQSPSAPHPTRNIAALHWALAAATTLHRTPEEIRQAFDPPLPSQPTVDAVLAFIRQFPTWTGTATDLLTLLPIANSPKVLSSRLRAHALALADAGVQLEFQHLRDSRLIHLRASHITAPSPQPAPDKELTAASKDSQDSEPCVTLADFMPEFAAGVRRIIQLRRLQSQHRTQNSDSTPDHRVSQQPAVEKLNSDSP